MNPSRFQAWLLDLDGTLYRATPLRLLMAAELAVCGWTAVRILRQFRQEHEKLRHLPEPAVSTPYRLQMERTSQALQVPVERVERVVEEWMQLRPRKWLRSCMRQTLIAQVEAFRGRGGRVAVVSDYPASVKLAALGMAPQVEVVVSSGETPELKQLKPAPDGYLLAAERLGIPADQCLVIGDRHDTDGRAAQAAKMEFLHVKEIHRLGAIQQPSASVQAESLPLPSSAVPTHRR